MTIPRRIINAGFFVIVLVSAMLAVSVPLWGRLLEPVAVVSLNSPAPVENSPVAAGQPVRLTVSRCNRTGRTLTFIGARTLVNVETGTRAVLPPVAITMEPGCFQAVGRAAIVPPETPPGRYSLFSVSAVRGRWRTDDIPWESQVFEVRAAP